MATNKPRLATIWLDGCSGCHMSLLDMDELLLEVADRAELVYGALVDAKEYPENVDVCLVEGAVSTQADLDKLYEVRSRTRTVVALGDCAVTANVPGMRNSLGVKAVLERAYIENTTINPGIPSEVVPALLAESLPLHAWVRVDFFVTGCPPPAGRIYQVISDLLDGRLPAAVSRFG